MRLDRSASSAVGIPVLPGLETGERKREGGEEVKFNVSKTASECSIYVLFFQFCEEHEAFDMRRPRAFVCSD